MLNTYIVSCKATRGKWHSIKTEGGVKREVVPINDLFTGYEFKVHAYDEVQARSACIREVIKKHVNSTMYIKDIHVKKVET